CVRYGGSGADWYFDFW
nr:immunoglobulin heavy chain junction region [Macaca mulatta]MOX91967.1 immunoglobulin heavy chain junction region [Macaca mulatta]MOX93242.1 immunoglobulin heavy chain junction region [Macaca mulatta]MOX93423.1 immunoglobulin heavy chain junction region [Macaca mulatta]MOX94655.1 immunoglobulin heavy chain junction region [Macaca mulatta]